MRYSGQWIGLLMGLSLLGCTGSMEKMTSWMGVSEVELMRQMGQPDQMDSTPFGLVRVWYRNPEEPMGCRDEFTINQGVITGFASNCGVWGGFGVPTYRQ